MSQLYIDFEAFQCSGSPFIIKELCVMARSQSSYPLHYIFKVEQDFSLYNCKERRTFNYQATQLHGLTWYEGYSRYCRRCIYHAIETRFPQCHDPGVIFHVIGEAKLKFLRREFPKLRFELIRGATLPNLPEPPPNLQCMYRPHGKHCAALKCYQMYLFQMNI